MPFPFALSRMILLFFIVITNAISAVLAAITFHEKTGGAFQALAICFDILSLLTVIGCLCYQCASRDEEVSNTRNLCLSGICGLFGIAASLTVHARQDGGMGICNDFANAGNPCVHAGAQICMAYVSPVLASVGFIISWIDKFPGAVKVMPRYPITKAPSSHFAAHGHDVDESYTRPTLKASSRSRNNSGWTDAPLNC
ncbi:hypothetical protein OG21DRAFT_1497738 [Imleria badia]|nr:hypothetical protein OG21DRAFT_1497738 [Imleria badia]